jgi:hypothetical protein
VLGALMVPIFACAVCVLLLAWTLRAESREVLIQRPGERVSQPG